MTRRLMVMGLSDDRSNQHELLVAVGGKALSFVGKRAGAQLAALSASL